MTVCQCSLSTLEWLSILSVLVDLSAASTQGSVYMWAWWTEDRTGCASCTKGGRGCHCRGLDRLCGPRSFVHAEASDWLSGDQAASAVHVLYCIVYVSYLLLWQAAVCGSDQQGMMWRRHEGSRCPSRPLLAVAPVDMVLRSQALSLDRKCRILKLLGIPPDRRRGLHYCYCPVLLSTSTAQVAGPGAAVT